MPEGRISLRDIQGLTPAVDPTQSDRPFTLPGKNYVHDSKGAKSAFGNRVLTPVSMTKPDHAQGFRLRLKGGDRCFHFFAHGILEWDESAGGYQVIYATPDTALSPYRWTFEYLNGYLYFAHPGVGLLVYDVVLNRCDPHSEVADSTLVNVIAISQSNGRLGVLTQDFLLWSAPSDGLTFTPQLGGAGAQKISERVPGDSVMISSYARGFLCWTTGGVMRSEFTADVAVFRHRTLNTEYRPINSFCTARVDVDTVVILDERGLFRSRGEALEPYAPIFNEHLIDFLQKNKFRNGTNIRIEWDDRKRRLYISYSSSYANPIYEKCFVYYAPLDKWGEFNENHYGILPIIIDGSERADDMFGFVDSEATVRYWNEASSREQSISESSNGLAGNLYVAELQKPVQYDSAESGQIASSTSKLRTFDPVGISQIEAFYVAGATSPLSPTLKGLDSVVRIGLIRLVTDRADDEMGEVTQLLIRNVLSGAASILTEDFNLVPSGTADEDFNVSVGTEDKGLEPINYINHGLRVIGTLDGESEFDVAVPVLQRFDKASRQYACSVVGIWHIVEITAESVGEFFHTRTIDMTGTSAGRFS